MMKKAFLVVVTMVLISKGIIFAQSTGTVTLEEYVPKVIINGRFGSKIKTQYVEVEGKEGKPIKRSYEVSV